MKSETFLVNGCNSAWMSFLMPPMIHMVSAETKLRFAWWMSSDL